MTYFHKVERKERCTLFKGIEYFFKICGDINVIL